MGVEARGVWLLPTSTAWTRFRIDGREDMVCVWCRKDERCRSFIGNPEAEMCW